MVYYAQGLFSVIEQTLAIQPAATEEGLAEALRVSRHTITRVVRDNTGLNFRAFRSRFLLTAAKKLLLDRPNFSIKEIASILGYSSPANFCRFFREFHGCSPQDFRESSPPTLPNAPK